MNVEQVTFTTVLGKEHNFVNTTLMKGNEDGWLGVTYPNGEQYLFRESNLVSIFLVEIKNDER
jgi:hypothetical protein